MSLEKLFDTPKAKDEVYQALVEAVLDLEEKEVNYHRLLPLDDISRPSPAPELSLSRTFEKPLARN